MECVGHLSDFYEMDDKLRSWFGNDAKNEYESTSQRTIVKLIELKTKEFNSFLTDSKDEPLDDSVRSFMYKSRAKQRCNDMLKRLLINGDLLGAWGVTSLLKTREFDVD
jgi:hypothetical protein